MSTCALALALLTASPLPALPPQPSPQSFEVMEATIPELQEAMTTGRISSKALVQAYLARIEAYDQEGPRLNSVIAVNPKALAEAEKLDAERSARGPRGPLHGIPVLLKDNFDTSDMPTTGASLALIGHVPPDDAFQVRKLREAGAVILGKTNMHELACGITTISSFGGQTRNPYDPRRNPGGSSGGTGAAIAASFAAVGMGSDTCGSIRIPSSHNSLVGLRPTKGLSSIDGIIPLSHTQDVGGPLARTVTDLAIVLDATIGEDEADPATRLAEGKARPKFVESLDAGALKGARIGILNALFGESQEDQEAGRIIRAAIKEMEQLGADCVEVEVPKLSELLRGSSVIDGEFKFDLMDYLAGNPGAPISSLAELLEKGLYHGDLERTFRRRNSAEARDAKQYLEALAKRGEVQVAVLETMDEHKLDALVYPSMKRKAALVGERQSGSNCQLSASTGFPALVVPAGFTDDGLPVGLELFGRPLSDARLVSFAYAYEQATHHRKPPGFTPPLIEGRAPSPLTFEVEARGAAVVPPNNSSAVATAKFAFDRTTGDLSYSIVLTELNGADVLFAHIHTGSEGDNGPVALLVSNEAFTKLSGKRSLSFEDRNNLLEGRLYLLVGTKRHPAGELRAQLLVPGAN